MGAMSARGKGMPLMREHSRRGRHSGDSKGPPEAEAEAKHFRLRAPICHPPRHASKWLGESKGRPVFVTYAKAGPPMLAVRRGTHGPEFLGWEPRHSVIVRRSTRGFGLLGEDILIRVLRECLSRWMLLSRDLPVAAPRAWITTTLSGIRDDPTRRDIRLHSLEIIQRTIQRFARIVVQDLQAAEQTKHDQCAVSQGYLYIYFCGTNES